MKEERFLYLVHCMVLKEIIQNIKTFQPIIKNGWEVQFSEVHGHILMYFTSTQTGQTIIRYFTDENKAAKLVTRITSNNPSQEYLQNDIKD